MSAARIPCPRCKGGGLVEPTKPLADAMQALDAAGEWITSRDLAEVLGISQANAVSRLERLRHAGALERQRTIHPSGGVEFVYSRSDQ